MELVLALQLKRQTELVFVLLLEGGLLFFVGAIGLALNLPLLFTSLGPTAYEQIEKPAEQSAHPYNIIVGHMIA